MNTETQSPHPVGSSAWLASDEQTKDFMRWFGMATGLWADFDAAPPAGKEMWRRKATEYHKAKLANDRTELRLPGSAATTTQKI